ncbi:MAG: tetratricopeptide repeat protein [Candidatus Nealsonbacteria bacterium]|nr:tetratricopeptide repeat protein [Candidatus Nealsonbacteria bacterium]
MTSDLLATARAYHEAGNLGGAEELYRRILATEPRHADALHLLGPGAASGREPAGGR